MTLDEAMNLSDHRGGLDFLYEKVLALAKDLPERVPFLEIGTRAGGSALVFLHAILASGKLNRPLITVDPYGNKGYWVADKCRDTLYGESFYWQAMVALSLFAQEHELFHVHYRMRSLDFAGIWPHIPLWHNGEPVPVPFGFVYLDGEHIDKTVARELEWAITTLHTGGLIVIDDSEHILKSEREPIPTFIRDGYAHGNRLYGEY